MRTVPYDEADPEIAAEYKKIYIALEVPQVPIFFTYLGAYPKYFSQIVPQFIANVGDRNFIKLRDSIEQSIRSLVKDALPASPELSEWVTRNRYSPSFYHLSTGLEKTNQTNITLALFFIALREAIKGWAVAVTKLSSGNEKAHSQSVEGPLGYENQDLVLSGFFENEVQERVENTQNDEIVAQPSSITATNTGIERNLFVEYMRLMELEYNSLKKMEQYVLLRVGIEKILLQTIHMLPHPIISPVNMVYTLAAEYPDFPDLLYLLSEQFPTRAAERVIVSGYLLP